ncbi:hypothetical protein [Comamonas odontotermitis]|uniref:hypothetical protein n=1 Tax=Comamonas odontotermitis TaxID=379895 RepID=UPI0037529D73
MTFHARAHDTANASVLPLLDEWKRLTQAGLQASRAHCAAHALTWHVKALRVANRLLLQSFDGVADDDRLAAFVVAHLNIADCYADMGQLSEAAECVDCAHHRLLALLQDEATPHPLRQAAYRHLHQTFAAQRRHSPACAAKSQIQPSFIPPTGSLLH